MHLSHPRRILVAATATATAAAIVLPGFAGAATARPPAGVATSTLTVLRATLSGTAPVQVVAGQVAGVAGTTSSPHVVRITVTPISSSATGPVGQQTVTPSSSPVDVPSSPATVTLPAGLGSVTGPTLHVSASDTAAASVTSATLKAIGGVTVATLPVNLQGVSLGDTAQVTSAGAAAQKSLVIDSLALPSIDDLLASLGVDLDALARQLTQGKLDELAGLVGAKVKALNDAVDTAQAAITGTVPATYDSAVSALATAKQARNSARSAYNGARDSALGNSLITAALNTAGLQGSTTYQQFLALGPTADAAIDAIITTAGGTALTALATAADDAQTVVNNLNALIDALQALLDAVVGAITGNTDPLAALGGVSVSTSAVAARTAHAFAKVTAGSVHVLGVAKSIKTITSALDSVTSQLSDVLSSVAGVTFAPPAVSVGTPVTSTHRQGQTRYATSSITGLIVTLPTLTLPAALSLTGNAISTPSGSLMFGQLAEAAQWTPGQSAPQTPGHPQQPGTPNSGHPSVTPPTLPDTGGRAALPVAALLVIGLGLALRRRLRTGA